MPERSWLARFFLVIGGILAAVSLILWLTLPIRPMFPPFLGTALLALGYGAWCRFARRASAPPRRP